MRIYDLHADIGTDIFDRTKLDNDKEILKNHHLNKLKKGEVRGVAMACFFRGDEDWSTMQEMVRLTQTEINANSDQVRWVKEKTDMIIDDRLLGIISVEGMCGIKTKVKDKIDWLYENGVRIGSLCWNDSNKLAEGWPNNPLRGLTRQGQIVIRRMNELNMIIDISHTNEKSFWDIITLSDKPIIATHSNARSLCNHQRNLTDQQIKAIALKGGLIGLNAAKGFVSLLVPEQNSLTLAKHARYMADMVGYQHIACGFDYMDFFEDEHGDSMAQDLTNAADSQNLIHALKEVGFSEKEIEAIAYKNVHDFLVKYL